jgi:hypothetical protein
MAKDHPDSSMAQLDEMLGSQYRPPVIIPIHKRHMLMIGSREKQDAGEAAFDEKAKGFIVAISKNEDAVNTPIGKHRTLDQRVGNRLGVEQ